MRTRSASKEEKCRSVDKFGRLVPARTVKFPIDRLVIASPPRPLLGFFRSWSACSPQWLDVQVPKKTDLSKTWPPSAILYCSYYRISLETTYYARLNV